MVVTFHHKRVEQLIVDSDKVKKAAVVTDPAHTGRADTLRKKHIATPSAAAGGASELHKHCRRPPCYQRKTSLLLMGIQEWSLWLHRGRVEMPPQQIPPQTG